MIIDQKVKVKHNSIIINRNFFHSYWFFFKLKNRLENNRGFFIYCSLLPILNSSRLLNYNCIIMYTFIPSKNKTGPERCRTRSLDGPLLLITTVWDLWAKKIAGRQLKSLQRNSQLTNPLLNPWDETIGNVKKIEKRTLHFII